VGVVGSLGGFSTLSPHQHPHPNAHLPSHSNSMQQPPFGQPPASIATGTPLVSMAAGMDACGGGVVGPGVAAGVAHDGGGGGRGGVANAARVASLKLMRRFSALSVKCRRDDSLAQVRLLFRVKVRVYVI
jgi:hypothetical protein